MLALKITEQKKFMGALLTTEAFDSFLLSEATIDSFASFSIDGRLNEGFFSSEELAERNLSVGKYLPYGVLRPFCLNAIKGRHTPVHFRFVLLLSEDMLSKLLASSGSNLSSLDVYSACFTVTFQAGEITVTNGISYQSFVPDHTLDIAWDNMLKNLLKSMDISFDEI